METQTFTVQEIHNSFFSAGENALNEAKELLNRKVDDKKSSRLSALGFTSAKPVKDVKNAAIFTETAKKTIEAVQYFTIHYPQYKFITNENVKKLCEKYGLMEGGCDQYLGDIPEKNIRDIEAFKLRKEDYVEPFTFNSSGIFRWFEPSSMQSELDRFGFYDPGTSGVVFNKSRRVGSASANRLFSDYLAGVDPVSSFDQTMAFGLAMEATAISGIAKDKTNNKEQPKFRICAPKSDFNTLGYEVREGYKLVYDPIVLQPVEYNGIKGNLIITAWGEEASDETVVNQTMN